MKIPLSIISRELSRNFSSLSFDFFLNSGNPEPIVDHYIQYTSECSVPGNCLLIITAEAFADMEKPPKSGVFLIVGEISSPPAGTDCICVTSHESIRQEDVVAIENSISCIFSKFSSWQENLFHAVQNDDLQAIAVCTQKIVGMEVSIIDPDYCVLASSNSCEFSSEKELSSDQIDDISGNSYYQNALSFTEPYTMTHGSDIIDSLCCNIFVDGHYYGKTLFGSPQKPVHLCPGDRYLIYFFTNYVQMLLAISPRVTRRQSELVLRSFFTRILSDNEPSPEEFDYYLSQNSFIDQHCFICFMKLNNISGVKTPEYYAKQISTRYPGIFVLPEEKNLIAFLFQKQYPSLSDFMEHFRYFLRDNLIQIGCSNKCCNLYDAKYYLIQAKLALEYGLKKEPSIWVHTFEECKNAYCIDRISGEIPARLLLHPSVVALLKYDEERDTDYLNTLKVYLSVNLNAQKAAEHLFVHYNTMNFRIRRLQKIADIDFNNAEDLFQIQLSIHMIENLNPGAPE